MARILGPCHPCFALAVMAHCSGEQGDLARLGCSEASLEFAWLCAVDCL